MTKFRKDGRDTYTPPPEKPEEKPGDLPKHRIPIFDHKGRRRGHVGYKASAATVARFTGQHGAKLGKKEGRTAWLSPPPPPPKKPEVDPTAVAVAKTQAASAPKEQNHKLEISLNAAKGSVSSKPSAPKTTARPKRSK